ncbi:MAG TPA: HDOD domain-containing protein [Vicinamibacterales bacterium]|nr:HDOD domain-containing protein [Vicinamibacterales bacterium]
MKVPGGVYAADETRWLDLIRSSTMQIFVARQPIFDRQDHVIAYELLFRSGLENYFTGEAAGADSATSHVISNGSFLGLDTLCQGKHAFINFPRSLLVSDAPLLLPRDRVVIEILETVEPDVEVIAACRRLKRAGYRIALDDFPGDETHPLVPLADFVKVDFLAVPTPERRTELAKRLRAHEIGLIAEKVETKEAKDEGARAGYHYFQGYFLSHPDVVSARSVPAFRMNYLRLLQEVTRPDATPAELETIVKQDLSITYRLLRHINSAAFGFRTEIKSLRFALVLLGLDEIRRWASVWALADLGRDAPDQLVADSVMRARFCEMVVQGTPLRKRAAELFLMGLFSRLDVIIGRPLEEILTALPVPPEARAALLGEPNTLRSILDAVIAYEAADWDGCARTAASAGLTDDDFPTCYLAAMEWAHKIFRPRATGVTPTRPRPMGRPLLSAGARRFAQVPTRRVKPIRPAS